MRINIKDDCHPNCYFRHLEKCKKKAHFNWFVGEQHREKSCPERRVFNLLQHFCRRFLAVRFHLLLKNRLERKILRNMRILTSGERAAALHIQNNIFSSLLRFKLAPMSKVYNKLLLTLVHPQRKHFSISSFSSKIHVQ